MKVKPTTKGPPDPRAAILAYLESEGATQAELIRKLEPLIVAQGVTAQGLDSRLSALLSPEANGSRIRSLLAILGAFFRVSGVDPRNFFGV